MLLALSVSTALCFSQCGEDNCPTRHRGPHLFRVSCIRTVVQPRVQLFAAAAVPVLIALREDASGLSSMWSADGEESLLRLKGGGTSDNPKGPTDRSCKGYHTADMQGDGQTEADESRVGSHRNSSDVAASKTFVLGGDGKDPASAPPPSVGPLSLGERAVLESLRRLRLDRQASTLGKLATETPETLRRMRELGKVEEDEWKRWEKEMESQLHKKFSFSGSETECTGDGSKEGEQDEGRAGLRVAVDKSLDDDEIQKEDGGDSGGQAAAGDDILARARGRLRHLANQETRATSARGHDGSVRLRKGSCDGSRGAVEEEDKEGAASRQAEGLADVLQQAQARFRGQQSDSKVEMEVDVGWLPPGWHAKRVNNRIQYCNDFLRRVQVSGCLLLAASRHPLNYRP